MENSIVLCLEVNFLALAMSNLPVYTVARRQDIRFLSPGFAFQVWSPLKSC